MEVVCLILGPTLTFRLCGLVKQLVGSLNYTIYGIMITVIILLSLLSVYNSLNIKFY